ncbi:MAG: MBL fold metallo-hydrolase [Solirubrobacteraceae bacterium]
MSSPAVGVHRIAVPTPWMGTVNAYLLEGDPLTLVDTGPGLTASTALLADGLRVLGHRIEDVELIVLTHQHFDHVGAADVLRARSGASVAAFGPSVAFLGAYPVAAGREDDWVADLMRRHGASAGTVAGARSFAAFEAHLASPVVVDLPLDDGDELRAGGRALRVLHRPGHSPSDIVLLDPRDGLLLAGDHLLGRVTSNALLALPLDADGPIDPTAGHGAPLIDYRRSLRRTRQLPASLVLGGHDEPFDDHVALIDERLVGHERRAERLLSRLGGDPRSAFSLAVAHWGPVAEDQPFLVLSEVLGHLDLLVDAGTVSVVHAGDAVLFARA